MKNKLIALAVIAMAALPVTAQGTKPKTNYLQRMDYRIAQSEMRIQELERKVAGMQKQITILHGKKQDKPKGKNQ